MSKDSWWINHKRDDELILEIYDYQLATRGFFKKRNYELDKFLTVIQTRNVQLDCEKYFSLASWGGHTRECLGGVTTEEALLQKKLSRECSPLSS